MKGSKLVRIEAGDALCSKLSLLLCVVVKLLCNKTVAQQPSPVLYNLRHGGPILKPLASLRKELVNQVEAIILNLCFRGICNNSLALKTMSKVITDIDPKGVPQCPWISMPTITQNGDKEVAKLLTNLHVLCFLQALIPLIVIFQEASRNTGFPECVILLPLKGIEVLKRGDARDSGKKKV